MKLTKFMLLGRNIRCTVICVIEAKYEINKIYVIKAKYKKLVIGNLGLFLYAQLVCFITYSFGNTTLPYLVFSYSEILNLKFVNS